MSRFNPCDQCGEREVAREVRISRPSDPADLCCIMALCAVCAPVSGPTVKTAAEWLDYIESAEAVAAGHLWLS